MAEFLAVEAAEQIERGLSLVRDRTSHLDPVRETPGVFLERSESAYLAGALGLALIGKTGNPAVAWARWRQVTHLSIARKFDAAARMLGIPYALVRLIGMNHRNGIRASEIACALRAGSLGLSLRKGAVAWSDQAESVDTIDIDDTPRFLTFGGSSRVPG